MFAKFLIGCLSLAALLIIGGTYVVKNESQQRVTGNYLIQAARRLNGYVDRVGRSTTAFAEIYSNDPALRAAMMPVAPTTPAPTPAPAPPAGQPAAPPPAVEAAPNTAKLAEVARRLYDQLKPPDKAAAETHWALDPDVFAIFSAGNKLLYASAQTPVVEADLPTIGAVAQARNGNLFTHRVQLLRGVPYQTSAFPIRGANGEVIGGIMIGIRLERIFIEWSRQTDEDPVKQMRPTLLDGVTVMASAWPDKNGQAAVARAIQPEKHFKMSVFGNLREVTKIGNEIHDVWFDEFEAYKGLDNGKVGRLFLTRNRAAQPDTSSLPVTEIIAGIIASIIIALLLAYWVTRPIKQMVKQSRELLAGETDLTQRITVSSSDETADLAENINQVFARVHSLAKEVQDAAFQVGNSSAEISAASRQMLTGLKDQTLKIESSTTAVTELSASIQQVAGNAAQATDVAEQSSTAVNSAVQRMEQIRSAVDDAAGKMRELGESSKRIGNIVEVIRQISEQTSMLALNASIEAAHAGEQGRGFAVVADEVSSLARRVGQSAKDIEALIQTVKEQTQAAITSMDVGAREVLGGSQLVTSTLTGLSQLIMVVKETASAVHEQAVVSDEIARNMDAVRMLAGEALHGSEESVSSASRLHDLAFQLEESIAGFNLEGQKVVSSRAPANSNGNPIEGSGPQRALPPGRRKAPPKSHEASD